MTLTKIKLGRMMDLLSPETDLTPASTAHAASKKIKKFESLFTHQGNGKIPSLQGIPSRLEKAFCAVYQGRWIGFFSDALWPCAMGHENMEKGGHVYVFSCLLEKCQHGEKCTAYNSLSIRYHLDYMEIACVLWFRLLGYNVGTDLPI